MADHPFASYNKEDGYVPTLVGNWTEERALAEKTGEHRLKTWVEKPTLPDATMSVYANHVTNPEGENPTFRRTLEHNNQTLSAEYLTTNQVVYQKPSARTGELATYMPTMAEGMGTREAAELAAMMAEAKHMNAGPEASGLDYSTTYGTMHGPKQREPSCSVGARVMMTQDKGPVYRDPTFLKETKLMAPEVVGKTMPGLDASMGATKTTRLVDGNALNAPALTIYSEAAATGAYTGKLHGTTNPAANRGNPFGTSRNFTKPLSAHDKVVIDE